MKTKRLNVTQGNTGCIMYLNILSCGLNPGGGGGHIRAYEMDGDARRLT